MADRLRHALRFALTTLAAVYVVGLAWEAFDVFVSGDVAEGLTAAGTFGFNERVWRAIALAEAVVVFLLRVGDLEQRPPSWGFAWGLALWLGVASVAAAMALEAERWELALLVGVAAALVWFGVHRRLPGWPGRRAVRQLASLDGGLGESERELP